MKSGEPLLRVRVELMGPFELEAGVSSADVTLPSPATVGTLLQVLASRWPAAEKLWYAVANDASPRQRYCYVSLDYTMLLPHEALDTPLHDGARVCFGMPMVGG